MDFWQQTLFTMFMSYFFGPSLWNSLDEQLKTVNQLSYFLGYTRNICSYPTCEIVISNS